MVEVTYMTRRQRRAQRQQGLVTDREAQQVARRAGLDYKVSGESGALRVTTRALNWHRRRTPNGTTPPADRGWDRSGATYVVGTSETRLRQPIIHHQWRKLIADQ